MFKKLTAGVLLAAVAVTALVPATVSAAPTKNIVEKGYPLTITGHRNRTPVEDLILFEGWSRLSRFERAMAPGDRLAASSPGAPCAASRWAPRPPACSRWIVSGTCSCTATGR